MKKITALLIICFAINNCEGQTLAFHSMNDELLKGKFEQNNLKSYSRTNVAFLDSVIYWKWDSTNNIWNNLFRLDTYQYNSNNDMTHYVLHNWSLNSWENYYNNFYTYDANGNDTNVFQQSWNGTSWINLGQITYVYDVNNNETSTLGLMWNGTSWDNYNRTISTYNVNNLLVTYLTSVWNNISWYDNDKTTNTYNLNNQMTNRLIQQWNGTSWNNYNQTTFTYDLNNNMIGSLTKRWSLTIWENEYKETYTYDLNNNLISDLNEQWWNSSYWRNRQKQIYSYDSNNNQLTHLYQWVDNNGILQNDGLHSDTYDSNNILTDELDQIWNGVVWVNNMKIHYYFHTFFQQGVNDLNENDNVITISPNPFTSQTTISFSEEQKHTTIKIMDVLGNTIQQSTINNQQSTLIDMSDVAKGIYFLEITDENKNVMNKKIVVQ